jgi:SAM-dependent methyltransferase
VGSLSFDPIADRYDATRGGEPRGRFLADLVLPWLPADGLVAEIGVGTAVVASALAARGTAVAGFDLSGRMLDVASGRFGGPLVLADVAELPVRAGSLAAAYAVWVLHLVDDVGAVVAECRRALRPGGRFVAVVDDAARRVGAPELLELEDRYRRRADRLPHLDPIVRAAGFEPVAVKDLAAFRRPTSRAELADHLEKRTWSWLWTVPTDRWGDEVVPVIAALRASEDPTPIDHQVANQLVVWER